MTDQHIPGDLLHRAKVITGLRQLADWLDAHPDVPVPPFGWDLPIFPGYGDETARRAEVDMIAAALGVPVIDDTGQGGHYIASRTLGLIIYRAICIPDRRQAAHEALMSYRDCVTPARAGAEAVTP